MLSAALAVLLPHEVLPKEDVPHSLRAHQETIALTVGVPPAESRSLAEVWSALGGELKPSLDVVITLPFPVTPTYPVGPPVTEGAVVTVRGKSGAPDGSRPRMLRTALRGRTGE